VRNTAMNPVQRGKLAIAAAAIGVGLLSVTGCGFVNAQQTTHQYSASDGIKADLGTLAVAQHPDRCLGRERARPRHRRRLQHVRHRRHAHHERCQRRPDRDPGQGQLGDVPERHRGCSNPQHRGVSSQVGSPRSPSAADPIPPRSTSRWWTAPCPSTPSTCPARPLRRQRRRRAPRPRPQSLQPPATSRQQATSDITKEGSRRGGTLPLLCRRLLYDRQLHSFTARTCSPGRALSPGSAAAEGSGSILLRSRLTWTSSVLVSPT
jgi:hypothetical protein